MGPVGIEMAQALSRLGLEMAGFDIGETIAAISDPEIAGVATEVLGREFPLHLGAEATLSEAVGGISVSAGNASFTADAVLAAIGRRPNVDNLGLESLGVPLDEQGMPEVDPTTLQIGKLPVWLAGDANGHLPLLHEAADEGHIAGRNAMAETFVSHCRRAELAIIFSSPGIARVGRRFADLDFGSIAIGCADFSRQGRARMAERAEGLMRDLC